MLSTSNSICNINSYGGNLLYSALQKSSEEPQYLPLFNRRDLIRTKFLGSGAFGEVYRGVASGLNGAKETHVAIKVRDYIILYIPSSVVLFWKHFYEIIPCCVLPHYSYTI